MRGWTLLKPGDWLIIFLTLGICVFSFSIAWPGGAAQKVLIKRGGKTFAEFDLNQDRQIDVPGALGITRVAIEKRRVRVLSDPGPQQYCVRQSWLARVGEVALCAPNRVSVEILGAQKSYDTLSY